ncbi:MAG: peptidylprolyl isomerase [Candidatus Micrarchaeota archaeon]|nr:peptidylprolyl isomerase [Candidatus Micrarchaeota archaeon]
MRLAAALLAPLLLLVFGCAQIQQEQKEIRQQAQNLGEGALASAPAVSKGDVVEVYYIGRLENGSIFDSNTGGIPLEFEVGSGQMIAGFEAGLIGMREGEKRQIRILPSEAYGERQENKVVWIPISQIEGGEKIAVGSSIYAGGQTGKVVDVAEGAARVDFNHELAGKTLVFDVWVRKIKKAGS